MTDQTQSTTVIGLISDTHGLLRPEVFRALQGVDMIVHAGDVGSMEILEKLGEIAPVIAVRGNTDRSPDLSRLPATAVVEAGGVSIYVLHEFLQLDLDPAAAGFQAVIYGHTHEPWARRRKGVLYLNPGSAGPRRFDLPICVARLIIRDGEMEAEFVNLG